MPDAKPSAYLISDPSSESGALDTLPETNGLRVVSREQLRQQNELRH